MVANLTQTSPIQRRCLQCLLQFVLLSLLAALPYALFLVFSWQSPKFREAIAVVEPHSAKIIGLVGVILAMGIQIVAWLQLRPRASVQMSRRIPKLVSAYLLLGASVIVFTSPLIHLWTKVPEYQTMIGGLIPFSDAHGYYEGASNVLVQGELSPWTSRRPLNALLLAARLSISGNDLRGALLIQAIMLGVAAFMLAKVVARDFGGGVALLLFAMIYAVSREHVGNTLSESLGLTLGTLAAALLWSGARDKRALVAAAGLLVLTLALNARAGAFFMLPAVVVWAGFAFRHNKRLFSWRSSGLASGAVVIGFLLNGSLLWAYGSGFGVGHGNFSHTLYGLATGKADWTQVYRDHPETATLGEREQNAYIYRKAVERIRQRPQDLLKGYIGELDQFGIGIWRYCKQFVDVAPSRRINRWLRTWLIVFVARFLWVYRRESTTWLLLTANLGLLLSGPVIWHDGGTRVLVASWPLLFLFSVIGVGVSRKKSDATTAESEQPATFGAAPALAFSAMILLLAFVAPAVGHWCHAAHLVPTPADPSQSQLVLRIGPGTPHLKILPQGSTNPTFAPRITKEDLARYFAAHEVYFPESLTRHVCEAGMMTVVHNLRADAPGMWYVLGPPAMISDEWRWFEVSGEVRQFKALRCLIVSNYKRLSAEPSVRASVAFRASDE